MMNTQSQTAQPVISFDYRYMAAPFQVLDSSRTFVMSGNQSRVAQKQRIVLRISPQRLAESVAQLAQGGE